MATAQPFCGDITAWPAHWPVQEKMKSMCDWGKCNENPVAARYNKENGWLPVCKACSEKPIQTRKGE